MPVRIGIAFVMGAVLFINAAAYFTTSSLGYGVEYQQLVQIKHLMWMCLAVYIASQVK